MRRRLRQEIQFRIAFDYFIHRLDSGISVDPSAGWEAVEGNARGKKFTLQHSSRRTRHRQKSTPRGRRNNNSHSIRIILFRIVRYNNNTIIISN